MFEFFFKYFLIFPKIQLGGADSYSGFGILIGEIVLIFYLLKIVVFQKKVLLNIPLMLLLLFFFYFIFFSSFLNWPLTGIFPFMSGVYLFRILLYGSLFVFCYSYWDPVNERIIKKFFIIPFAFQCLAGTFIVVVYYLTHSPTMGQILGEYNTGLRLIPFAGLSFSPDSFFFLMPIGGGSGNLLASWALAVLILADNFKVKQVKTVMLLVLLTVALSMSRGGLLTIGLYLIYIVLKNIKMAINLSLVLVFLALAIGGLSLFVENENSIFTNVFTRVEATFGKTGLDGSSLARIRNYSTILNVWSQNPFFIFFGMGYDEEIMRHYTNYSIVESFILQVLTSSGLIGTSIFVLFYISVYALSKVNLWFNSLWKFVVFESIVQWTITGGDFVSPHVLFVFMTFLGFGYKELRRGTELEAKLVS